MTLECNGLCLEPLLGLIPASYLIFFKPLFFLQEKMGATMPTSENFLEVRSLIILILQMKTLWHREHMWFNSLNNYNRNLNKGELNGRMDKPFQSHILHTQFTFLVCVHIPTSPTVTDNTCPRKIKLFILIDLQQSQD